MKKILAVMTAMVLAMSILAGCGSGSGGKDEIIGTWKAKTYDVAGVSMDVEKYAESLGVDADAVSMTIEFTEDGKATVAAGTTSTEGEWKKDGDSYTLTSNGVDETVTIKDGKLIYEVSGMKITFEK